MRQLPHIENFLRTPEERFQNLPDFSFAPHYTQIGGLRIAYIDEGPKDGPVVLLMHRACMVFSLPQNDSSFG